MLVPGLDLTCVLIFEDFLRLKWHLAHLGCALAATEIGALEIADSDACGQSAGLGVGPCLHGRGGKDGCAAVSVLQARPVACQGGARGSWAAASAGQLVCAHLPGGLHDRSAVQQISSSLLAASNAPEAVLRLAALRPACIGWRNGGQRSVQGHCTK